MKIYYIDNGWQYWYDRTVRCWFAAKFDESGHQINDSIDSYTKETILEYIKREESFGLSKLSA